MTDNTAHSGSVPQACAHYSDLVVESLELDGQHIEYLRPREPVDLLDDEELEGDQAYPPYWAEAWDSGTELAQAVSTWRLSGSSVVELGCGLGLPAIAAALSGGQVLATDRSAEAILFTRCNAERNAATIETAVCSWSDPSAWTARGQWQLVLTADVLYDRQNVAELLELIPRIVRPDGQVWMAEPRRSGTKEFFAAARDRWDTIDTIRTKTPGVHIHQLSGPRLS